MGELFRPQLWAPFLDAGIWRFLLTGLQTTLSMAAIAIAGSLVLGLFIAICRLSPFLVLRLPAIVFIALIRAVPVLLIVFFTFFGAARAGLGLDPFGAGTLALTVYTAAVNAEIMRAGITSIDRGQLEAARSLGLSYGQMMRYVVLPQAITITVPPLGNLTIALFMNTSLANAIAVPELLYRAQLVNSRTFATYEIFAFAALCYLTFSLPMGGLVNLLERRLTRYR
jgi:putative glutamine transport system permease protein